MLRIQPQVEGGEYQVDRSKETDILRRPPADEAITQRQLLLQLLNQLVLQTTTQPGDLSKAR